MISTSAVVVDFCIPIESVLMTGSILVVIVGLVGCFVSSVLFPTSEKKEHTDCGGSEFEKALNPFDSM
jgi:hypothetical protein